MTTASTPHGPEHEAVTARDGTTVPLRRFEARGHLRASIILAPAVGTRAARYDRFAAALAERGYDVVVFELRGVGESPVRPSRSVDFGYEQLITNDLGATCEHVRRIRPHGPVVLAGHSLGGHLASLYAAAHPDEVDGLALLASGSVHWRVFGRVLGLPVLAFFPVAVGLARLLGSFPGHWIRFGGTEARGLIRDWARAGMTGRWQPEGARCDYEARLAALPRPVLSVTFDRDLYCPLRSADALVTKLATADVTRARISSTELGARADHYEWARRPGATVDRLDRWLTEAVLAR